TTRVSVVSPRRMISPPRPPWPPSGPPSGLNFSRWTEAMPLPPLPARRCNVTRSTKLGIFTSPRSLSIWSRSSVDQKTKGAARNRGPPLLMDELAGLGLRDDADDFAAASGPEFHGAVLKREHGVVLAASDVTTGLA